MLKIDCHTHIINDKIKKEYFSKRNGPAVVMEFPDEIMPCPGLQNIINSDKRLFLCKAVSLKRPIEEQIEEIRKNLSEKTVGLKIYLCYQKGRADDEKLFPLYEFAREKNLSVVFHTGLCSLVLPSESDLKGCDAKYIAKAAGKFPEVNFVAAHMDDPRIEQCARLTSENPNMFTDFSGLFEPGLTEEKDLEKEAAKYEKAIENAPGIRSHILFGTDFCPPINLTAISLFDIFLKKVFGNGNLQDIYEENALRAFPRLKAFLGKDKKQN